MAAVRRRLHDDEDEPEDEQVNGRAVFSKGNGYARIFDENSNLCTVYNCVPPNSEGEITYSDEDELTNNKIKPIEVNLTSIKEQASVNRNNSVPNKSKLSSITRDEKTGKTSLENTVSGDCDRVIEQTNKHLTENPANKSASNYTVSTQSLHAPFRYLLDA